MSRIDVPSKPWRAKSSEAAATICLRRSGPRRVFFGAAGDCATFRAIVLSGPAHSYRNALLSVQVECAASHDARRPVPLKSARFVQDVAYTRHRRHSMPLAPERKARLDRCRDNLGSMRMKQIACAFILFVVSTAPSLAQSSDSRRWPAPVGHRQPTVADVTGAQDSEPALQSGRSVQVGWPDDVPAICSNCNP
jgi:hypothetical protein